MATAYEARLLTVAVAIGGVACGIPSLAFEVAPVCALWDGVGVPSLTVGVGTERCRFATSFEARSLPVAVAIVRSLPFAVAVRMSWLAALRWVSGFISGWLAR